MTATLKLVVETEMTENESFSEAPFMLVHVIPYIDGEPYFIDYKKNPFEALAMFAQGLKPGEVWPFNCECGMPACAGFNEPVLLTVDENHVIWKLPDDYESLTSSGREFKPREIIFGRGQYQASFEDLVAELMELESQHGHLIINPVPPGKLSVAETIERGRNRADYSLMLRETLGDLDAVEHHLVVTTSAGLELSTQLSQLVYEKTRRYLTRGLYDLPKTREVLIELAQDLRGDPVKVLRQLDVHWLSANLRAGPPQGHDDADDEEKWPVPYWTSKDSPSKDIDAWLEIQNTGKAFICKR